MKVVTAVVAHIDVGIANVLDAMPNTGSEYDYTLQLMDNNPL